MSVTWGELKLGSEGIQAVMEEGDQVGFSVSLVQAQVSVPASAAASVDAVERNNLLLV
jgi:hypothetical protein